jgi:hypothetical protein
MGRSAYPDKGGMGLARHKAGMRLGLSATVASAVLYSAIVLFGVGSASPSAPDAAHDPHASAVLIQAHADTVSGSVQRLPQASPEPIRHRPRTRARQPRTGVAPAESSAPSTAADPTPASPRVTESESPPSVASSTTVSVVDPPPVVTVPVIQVPTVTVPPLPELPVTLPELPAPPPLPLPLP